MIKKGIALMMCLATISIANGDEARNRISAMLSVVTSGVEVVNIDQTPVSNIMKVELSNGKYIYITRDAEFLFPGKMLQHTERGLTDLTEQDLALTRKAKLSNVDLSETITFNANNDQKAEIFVFTDVSCAYCKKLHRHIDGINEAGITVHYLAFPRAGAQAPAVQLMSEVWCADDRRLALTAAKQDGELTQTPTACDTPVAKQHELGLVLGVTGTPGVYDSEGRHLGGYLTPAQLRQALIERGP